MLRPLLLIAVAGVAWAAWRRPSRLATGSADAAVAPSTDPWPAATRMASAPDSPNAAERMQRTHEAGVGAGITVEAPEGADDDQPLTGAPAVQDEPIQPGLRDQFRGA